MFSKMNNPLKNLLAMMLVLCFVLSAGTLMETGKAHGSQQQAYDPAGEHLENIPPGFHSWRPYPGRIYPDGRFYPGKRHYFYPPYYPYPYHFYPRHLEPGKPWYEDIQPIPAGRVVLYVDPVHAKAFVNGYPLQRHADLTYEIGLLQGEHHVQVKADDYLPYERSIEIQGGELIRLTIRLEKESRH